MDLEDVLESVSFRLHEIVDAIRWPSAVEPLAMSAGQAFRRLTDIATGASKERVPTPHALNVASRMLSQALTSDWFPIRVPGVRLRDVALSRAIIVIALAPLIWTCLARLEFKTRALSRVLGRRMGAYALAVWIFCFSLYRDLLFVEAVVRQPQSAYFAQPAMVAAGALMVGIGTILVVSSMYALGIHGTYLGDYFGILMDAKVETFPFDMFDHPMYVVVALLITRGFLYCRCAQQPPWSLSANLLLVL
jgi:Phospholipid methyltransferase